MSDVLLITDAQGREALRCARKERSRRYSIVCVGGGGASYESSVAPLLSGLDCSFVRLGDHSVAAETEVRDFYLQFVHRFPRKRLSGGRTLLDILRRGDLNLWWFGETCEKGPIRGPLPQQLYSLALLHRILERHEYGEVWLDLEDTELAGVIERHIWETGGRLTRFSRPSRFTLSGWLNGEAQKWMTARMIFWRLVVVLGSILQRLAYRLSGFTCDRGESGIVLFSRYPALWQNAYTPAHRERYFGEVAGPLSDSFPVSYLVAPSDGALAIWKNRAGLAEQFRNDNIHPLPLYLGLADYGSVLFGQRLGKAVHEVDAAVRNEQVPFARWDISALWRAELKRSLTGLHVPFNLLLNRAMNNYFARRTAVAVVAPLEYQPMERAVWRAARESGVRAVAVQHSTYCRNHMMYFFEPGELRGYLAESVEDPSPMPDLFMAAGPRPAAHMRTNGVPEEKLVICGALRYNDLRVEPVRSQREDGRTEVFVGTSISLRESLSVIRTVAAAAAALGSAMAFRFKCHYHCRIEREIEQVMQDLAPAARFSIEDVNGPLHDFIRQADVVVVGGSTLGVEALALGAPVIVVQDPSLLRLSPLVDFDEAAALVSDGRELESAILSITEGDFDRGAFDVCRRESIRELFSDLDGRAHFRLIEAIRSLGSANAEMS